MVKTPTALEVLPGNRVSVPWGLGFLRATVREIYGPPGHPSALLSLVTDSEDEDVTVSLPVDALGWDVGIVGLRELRNSVLLPLVSALDDEGFAVTGDEISSAAQLRNWVAIASKKCHVVLIVVSEGLLEGLEALQEVTDVSASLLLLWYGVGPQRVFETAPALAALPAIRWEEGLTTMTRLVADFIDSARQPAQSLTSKRRSETSSQESSSLSDRLPQWVDSCDERFRALKAERLKEDPDRFEKGTWTVAYALETVEDDLSVQGLLQMLREVKGRETGWSPWWVPEKREIAPYAVGGLVECWMAEESFFNDPAHSDFWRALPSGNLFLLRGYQEDSNPQELTPGTTFDVTLPIWRVGECLLHATRFSGRVSSDLTPIGFQFRWRGLTGRRLTNWAKTHQPIVTDHENTGGDVTQEFVTTGQEINDDLASVVRRATQNLYASFDFFEPGQQMVDQELNELLRGNF